MLKRPNFALCGYWDTHIDPLSIGYGSPSAAGDQFALHTALTTSASVSSLQSVDYKQSNFTWRISWPAPEWFFFRVSLGEYILLLQLIRCDIKGVSLCASSSRLEPGVVLSVGMITAGRLELLVSITWSVRSHLPVWPCVCFCRSIPAWRWTSTRYWNVPNL